MSAIERRIANLEREAEPAKKFRYFFAADAEQHATVEEQIAAEREAGTIHPTDNVMVICWRWPGDGQSPPVADASVSGNAALAQ